MKVNHQQLSVDTDEILKTVFHLMSLDFAYLGIQSQPWSRDVSYPVSKWSNPYLYKAKYQLNTLFKRYVTKDEMCNVEVNKEKAFDAFLATQCRIGKHYSTKLSTSVVIQKARCIIKDTLGKYDEDKHLAFCRFGRRAATGLSYRESYLDTRVSVLTGSKSHIQWFKDKVIPKDDLLRRSIKGPFTEIQTLTLSDVDKSWDKRRTILKTTVIGGYYYAGLGDYMVDALRTIGVRRRDGSRKALHLSRLAEKHREVIKKYSRTLTSVTADLSSASDSFTSSLINRLFPRSWFNAMRFGRLCNVEVNGKVNHTTSFMTMGIGFTFPAQTIAFYSILRAIRDLLGLRGWVSAFGDDLIYPTRMHPVVVSVLTDIGFILNQDKTFVTTPFRESCGADYYDGIDVRPFQPEGKHEILSGLRALSFLYKMYNGLQQRWMRIELPGTFSYLLGQMQLFSQKLHQVPIDFPVTAGIQTRYVFRDDIFHQPYISMHGDHVFRSLSHKSRLREVPIQLPYLWEFLRQKSRGTDRSFEDRFLDPTDSTLLCWYSKKVRKSRLNKPPIWVVRLVPFVSKKGSDPEITEDWTLACDFAGPMVGE